MISRRFAILATSGFTIYTVGSVIYHKSIYYTIPTFIDYNDIMLSTLKRDENISEKIIHLDYRYHTLSMESVNKDLYPCEVGKFITNAILGGISTTKLQQLMLNFRNFDRVFADNDLNSLYKHILDVSIEIEKQNPPEPYRSYMYDEIAIAKYEFYNAFLVKKNNKNKIRSIFGLSINP